MFTEVSEQEVQDEDAWMRDAIADIPMLWLAGQGARAAACRGHDDRPERS
jgi:hypothetical protein